MFNGFPQAPWSHTYYHQYMQQHTQLTQWLQRVHGNASTYRHCTHNHHHCCTTPQNSGHNHCLPQNCQPHHCGGARNNYHHVPAVNMGHHVPAVNMGHHVPAVNAGNGYPPAYRYPAVPTMAEPYEERDEEYMDRDDSEDDEEVEKEEDSEGELIFNVDAILEMRATREISDRDSMDSFELLDSVKDDMHEYVKLDNYGNVELVSGKLPAVNMHEEEQNYKGELKILYGEKASTIGGMEALMAVQFDHMYDTLQPTLWPVLPLLL